jgi:ADP-ribose pyrophosphatase
MTDSMKELEKVPAKDKDLAWEEISVEHIVQDQWIDFRKSAFRYPDGRVFEPFYSYSRKDYVVIVASDVDGQYLCVRQFRQGIKEVTTEFPAGGVERFDGKEYRGEDSEAADAGASAAEELLETAKRELMEETGYESDEWEHLLTIPSNATIADNYATVFRAKNCRLVADQNLDETEVLHIHKYSAEQIEDMIYSGQFQQSVHVMAWLLAKEKERNAK